MKKAILLVLLLFVSVISTACINNLAVQELNTKAKKYLDNGDYVNAIGRLKSSVDLDGSIFETHYNLGIAYTQAEDYQDAINSLKTAQSLKPNFADTYYSLAVAQENYSQGIIDGNIHNKLQTQTSTNLAQLRQENESAIPTKRVLNSAQKAQVANLLMDSIKNYVTYLKINPQADDKQIIKQKIATMTIKLQEYDSQSPNTLNR